MTTPTQSLPFATPDLPGCGGQIKAEPAHFIVEEKLLYEPAGQGAHLYVSLTRQEWTTRQVAEALAQLFNLRTGEVGYAGLKDKHARCTQVFSLPGLEPAAAQQIAANLPFQVHWAQQHAHKLRVGHLLGNHFQITITGLAVPPAEALARAQAVAAALATRGLPNFFGAQRFGIDGANVEKGRSALLGRGPRSKWLRKLLISAYQAHLFNGYLARRVALGLFDRLLVGDIAKKADTGGMFEVEDVAAEQPRYERGEIHFTGPIFGGKMWAAKAAAAELESAILAEAELTAADFRQARVRGTRRPGRIIPPPVELTAGDASLALAFFLPKGAYATVALREFTKVEAESLLYLE